MNPAYACLVLLTCICFARRTPPGLIDYVECDENGKLTATKSDSAYWNISSSASCQLGTKNISIAISNPDNKLVFSGCPMGGNVVFTATPSNGGRTGHVVTTAVNDDLSVTLRCDAIASDTNMTASLTGLNYKATHSVTQINKNITETIGMVMVLRSNGSDVTNINLGSRYDLLIAGAGSHNTTVKRCTAADTTGTPEVEIYPGTGDTADTHVLTSFSKNADTSKTISGKQINQVGTLTGFRLVGSNTVVLKCTINVCAHSCELDKQKRGKHPSNVRYATLKLKVRDNSVQTTANGSAGTFPVGGLLTKFLLVIASMKFLF